MAYERLAITFISRLDHSEQPAYLIVPDGYEQQAASVPLVVSLHSWSGDWHQRHEALEMAVVERGWLYLFPNFRGPNNRPEACGSPLARQDILDAVAQVVRNYRVDRQRIYLTGSSGGGHMTMLMAGRHPEVWAAASAWVGISDLSAWHDRHAEGNYGRMLRACCGGAPGESESVETQYCDRSPLTHLHRAVNLPLDLAAGVHDGHQGSVPIRHTLDAFNVLAQAQGANRIGRDEIDQLSRPNGRLNSPQSSDDITDETFDRAIYLRRHAGPARVTIFEGGHEGLATATVAWFEQHARSQPIEDATLLGETTPSD